MGYCDPKAVRAGEPWYKQVNQHGFMNQGNPVLLPTLATLRNQALRKGYNKAVVVHPATQECAIFPPLRP